MNRRDPTRDFEGGYGVAHLLAKHGELVAMEVPEVIARGTLVPGKTRVFIELKERRVVLANNYEGQPANHWLVTAYEKGKGNR